MHKKCNNFHFLLVLILLLHIKKSRAHTLLLTIKPLNFLNASVHEIAVR